MRLLREKAVERYIEELQLLGAPRHQRVVAADAHFRYYLTTNHRRGKSSFALITPVTQLLLFAL